MEQKPTLFIQAYKLGGNLLSLSHTHTRTHTTYTYTYTQSLPHNTQTYTHTHTHTHTISLSLRKETQFVLHPKVEAEEIAHPNNTFRGVKIIAATYFLLIAFKSFRENILWNYFYKTRMKLFRPYSHETFWHTTLR